MGQSSWIPGPKPEGCTCPDYVIEGCPAPEHQKEAIEAKWPGGWVDVLRVSAERNWAEVLRDHAERNTWA